MNQVFLVSLCDLEGEEIDKEFIDLDIAKKYFDDIVLLEDKHMYKSLDRCIDYKCHSICFEAV